MYDVIVVGARVAGSPTAMLLARQGYNVLLVDKASFPSDTMSTHYIHQTGISCLMKWGLLERLKATNVPPIRKMSLDFGPVALLGTPTSCAGAKDAYLPRRTILDKLLVDAAVEAGVEVREQFTVDELTSDGGRITGVRGHSRGGGAVTESARIVVGADGRHSMVARAVQASTYNEVPARTCAYYSYWSETPVSYAQLYVRPAQMLIAAPTNDEKTMVINYWPVSEFNRVRSDVEGNFMTTLDAVPVLSQQIRAGQRAERFTGTADLANFYRHPYGEGWALVGDAGYHKDPITAQGISDAFRDAELLSAAIADGFSGRQRLEDALAEYEKLRNQSTLAMYEMTCDMARLAPPTPEQQALIGALIGNQEQIDRFFGTVAGTFPISEFFSESNLGSFMPAPV